MSLSDKHPLNKLASSCKGMDLDEMLYYFSDALLKVHGSGAKKEAVESVCWSMLNLMAAELALPEAPSAVGATKPRRAANRTANA